MEEFPTHPHPVKPKDLYMLLCCICGRMEMSPTNAYQCETCQGLFHKECLGSPMELEHPRHPAHPLFFRDRDYDDALLPQHLATCGSCGEDLGEFGCVYHCPTCNFVIHARCAMDLMVRQVLHPKSHAHELSLLPKHRRFTCDACGLTLDSPSLPYACLTCGAMIHRDCINLPRVIRISRHRHRLAFSPSLPPSDPERRCGVCRKAVDHNYGAYSCTRGGCDDYAVHSKCATREDVWDGKDLEGEPEEEEDIQPPFVVVDDKTIRHFSHTHHNLKLKEEDDDDDDDDGAGFGGSEHCQACARPARIHSGNLYSCTDCDCEFALHEKCANLPRTIWYMLHPHKLKLSF